MIHRRSIESRPSSAATHLRIGAPVGASEAQAVVFKGMPSGVAQPWMIGPAAAGRTVLEVIGERIESKELELAKPRHQKWAMSAMHRVRSDLIPEYIKRLDLTKLATPEAMLEVAKKQVESHRYGDAAPLIVEHQLHELSLYAALVACVAMMLGEALAGDTDSHHDDHGHAHGHAKPSKAPALMLAAKLAKSD